MTINLELLNTFNYLSTLKVEVPEDEDIHMFRAEVEGFIRRSSMYANHADIVFELERLGYVVSSVESSYPDDPDYARLDITDCSIEGEYDDASPTVGKQ